MKKIEKEFLQFIQENKQRFYYFAYSYTKNEQDALDVIQESLHKAWKALYKIKDIQSIKSWFYQILAHTAIDLLRKQKRVGVMEDFQLEKLSPKQCDTYKDVDVELALNQLPIHLREIVILRYFEDLKLDDIATILNMPLSTVKTQLYRALKLLKKQLKGDF